MVQTCTDTLLLRYVVIALVKTEEDEKAPLRITGVDQIPIMPSCSEMSML
jgi:hypothetical protein